MALFGQVTLYHWRQNFRHHSMWYPVVATPILGAVAFALVWLPSPALAAVFPAMLSLGIVIGLMGTYYHVAGVGKRVEGYTLNNAMVGPPPLLPLAITLVSGLGLAAVHRI